MHFLCSFVRPYLSFCMCRERVGGRMLRWLFLKVQPGTECHPAQCFTPFRVVKMPISINKMRCGPPHIAIKPRDTFGTPADRFRHDLREPRPLRRTRWRTYGRRKRTAPRAGKPKGTAGARGLCTCDSIGTTDMA